MLDLYIKIIVPIPGPPGKKWKWQTSDSLNTPLKIRPEDDLYGATRYLKIKVGQLFNLEKMVGVLTATPILN